MAGEVHGGNNQNFLSIEELLNIEKIVETFENIKKQISDKLKKNELDDNHIIIKLKDQIEEEELIKYINYFNKFITH